MLRYHFFIPFLFVIYSPAVYSVKSISEHDFLLESALENKKKSQLTPDVSDHPVKSLIFLKASLPHLDQHKMNAFCDELEAELLSGYLGYNPDKSKREFTPEEKEFVGQNLAQIFIHCPWLTHVNLSGLHLIYVPSAIRCLTELQELDLSCNFLKRLPDELASLQDLVRIRIKGNPLAAMSLALFKFLDVSLKLEQMEKLTRGQKVIQRRAKEVRQFFWMRDKNMKYLLRDELIEGYLGLTPNGAQKNRSAEEKKFIYRNLKNICNKFPYITHVNLSNFGYSNIPVCLTGLAYLIYLDLSHNDITQIPEEMGQMANLKSLNLSHNRIRYFSSILEDCDSLEHINFSSNQMIVVPKEMKAMPNVTVLDLSSNGLITLGTFDACFPNLVEFHVNHNQLTRLPDFLAQAPKLNHLSCRNNPLKVLHQGLMTKIQDLPSDTKQRLIENFHREKKIDELLGFAVDFNGEKLKNELRIGSIGIDEQGRLRKLSPEEKDFICSNFEEIFTQLPWLTHLNLDRMGLMRLPPGIDKLKGLQRLVISRNHIHDLPPFMADFTQLTDLNFSDNEFAGLPECLFSMTGLVTLTCEGNLLRSIPTDIGKLVNLVNLSLANNFIRSLPDQFYQLTKLINLHLQTNQLETLSPLVGNLVQLESLNISDNQFDALPVELGLLSQLKQLVFRNSRLQTLPYSLVALHQLEELNLDKNTFKFAADHRGMGAKDIKENFEAILKFSYDADLNLVTVISEPALYRVLDQAPLRWNRDKLAATKVPAIPQLTYTADSLMAEWASIWRKVNCDASDKPGYVDYYTLLQLDVDPKEKLGNAQLMAKNVLPRLNGFMKSLLEIPLTKEDMSGWVMQPRQRISLRNVIAFIFKNLQSCNIDQFYTVFMQFATGALACQTGQKSNFETILHSLQNRSGAQRAAIAENFDTQLLMFLAEEKERIFLSVVNDTKNEQAVHLIDHYKRALHDRLGLQLMMVNFKDIHGIKGSDRFGGSLGCVLKKFYDEFTPESFIEALLTRVATNADLAARRKLSKSIEDKAEIEQTQVERPFTLSSIVTCMIAQKLLSPDDVDEDEFVPGSKAWGYFSHPPADARAKLTPLAIEDILVKLGVLVRGDKGGK